MISVKNTKYTAYEQDIRELLQAFFPGETITGEEDGEAFFRVDADLLGENLALTGNRFEDKSVLKRELYLRLNREIGKTLPWGTLTGIKPVKLADQLLSSGMDERTASGYLKEHYLLSDEKRELVMEIALRERKLLGVLPEKGYSFYLGIPFCPTRCLYCSFTSNPIRKFEGRVEEYLEDCEKELRSFAFWEMQKSGAKKAKPSTFYIGGGTPTALSAGQLEKLLCSIEKYVEMDRLLEFTVEAGRPDSIDGDKLKVLLDHGVGRISVNPQTMNQKTLDLIGRRHTVEQTLEAYELARKAGFDNINMDVIMGLPGENTEDVRHTLQVIRSLAPDSLTVHALAVKRAARLSTEHDTWSDYARAEGEEVSEMTRMGAECARELGMKPYYLYRQKNIAGNQENTGYAIPGKESLYNIVMMEEKQPVIGFGAGSTTKIGSGGAERMENIKDLTSYLDRIDELVVKKERFLSDLYF